MDIFMLDSGIIGEKTEKAFKTIDNIVKDLIEFERIASKAYDEINDHNELESVHYQSLRDGVQYLDDYKIKYQKFGGTLSGYGGSGQKLIPNSYGGYANTQTYSGYMGYNVGGGSSDGDGIMTEYKSAVDYKFYTEKEALVERLSNTNLADIKVDNNIQVHEKRPISIFASGIQMEDAALKDKIGIKDLLTYSEISEILSKQYKDNKTLIDQYNKSLETYNPNDYPEGMPEYLKKAWFQLTKERNSSIENYDDYVNAIVTEADFNFQTNNEKNLTLALDLVPYVGEAKMGVEGLFGQDLVTGKKLNNLDRVLSMVPAGASAISKFSGMTIKDLGEIGKDSSNVLSMNGAGAFDNILKPKVVESDVDKVADGVGKTDILKNAGLDKLKVNEIVSIPKGSRPDPITYLSKEYIDMHLSQFDDGLSVIQTEWAYGRYSKTNGFVGVPDDNTLFVMPKKYCNEVVSRANGNISIIEKELGFPNGYFSDGGGLVRIDCDDVTGLNLRVPSGNETGANSLWLPGGYTSGNVPEAISDIIPLNQTSISRINVD